MKRAFILIFLPLVVASGCGDSSTAAKPELAAPPTLRADERDIAKRFAIQQKAHEEKAQLESIQAERRKQFEIVQNVFKRWFEARQEAGRTAREALAGPLTKLEAIKREAEVVEVNDCTAKAKTMLIESMSAMQDGLATFRQQTGKLDPALKEKLALADSRYYESEDLLAQCKPDL